MTPLDDKILPVETPNGAAVESRLQLVYPGGRMSTRTIVCRVVASRGVGCDCNSELEDVDAADLKDGELDSAAIGLTHRL